MKVILLFLAAAVLFAGTPSVRKELLCVPAWVQAGGAESDSVLTGEALVVKVNNIATRPAELLGPSDGLMLLVVTDMTGRIALADQAKSALNERIEKLPPGTLVGLLRSQDGLRVITDPTDDRSALKASIDALPVSGRAGLLETIQTVTELGDGILARAAVRLAVLYITDSDIENYREDFTNPVVNSSDRRDISRRFQGGLVRERISTLDVALSAAETPVFIVHLAYRTDELNQAYQTGLMTLAAATGGTTYFCRSQTEISEAIGEAFDAILSHYSVRVPVSAEASSVLDVTLESPGLSLKWRSRFTLAGE